MACKHCGKPVPVKQARYCSDACRMRAYRARKQALKGIVGRAINAMETGAPTSRLISADDLANVVDIAKVQEWSESLKKHWKPR